MQRDQGTGAREIPCQIAHEKVTMLVALCWVVYFATNLGRLNYGAVLAEILTAEGFSNAAGGLVSTGFFISYGAGQLLSGFVGDYVRPKWMVAFGVTASAVANLAMSMMDTPGQLLAVWCLNGAVQATVWTPILRIVAEYLPIRFRHRACVGLSTTYPAAALLTYLGCAGLVLVLGWRGVFRITALLMLLAVVLWIAGFRAAEQFMVPVEPSEEVGERSASPLGATGAEQQKFPFGLLAVICLALVVQGILRDGVMTWVPAYLTDRFQVGVAFSIFSTALLPIVNLAGVWGAGALHKRNRNELYTSAILFAVASAAGLVLFLLGWRGLVISLLSFACITSGMMGVNLMLVSFVPTYFTRWGKVSLVAGLVNSMVYVGSSIATYGIGAIADTLGWDVLLLALLAAAMTGGALCLSCIRRWRLFSNA